MIVLAEERTVSEELLEHPENLRPFIQSGLLFGVDSGTAVEIIVAQGNSIKVIVAEGQMRGRSGLGTKPTGATIQARYSKSIIALVLCR